MRNILLLLAVSCLRLLTVTVGQAQSGDAVLAGTILDPSGQAIAGATLTLVNAGEGQPRAAVSGSLGAYRLADLPVGTYHLKVTYPGFLPYSRDVTLDGKGSLDLNVVLQLAASRESITVTSRSVNVYAPLAGTHRQVGDGDQARSRNVADLLGGFAGVSLRQNGELTTVPMVHGMGDERTKLVVNGMTVSTACANHMNPPLSYIVPSQVARVNVMAGIVPVSMGGDSTGATISIDSPPPVFAKPGERLRHEGAFSTFFRSNGPGYGVALRTSIATENLSLGYSGSWSDTDDYRDGSGHQVTSTYAQSTNHFLVLAAQKARNLFVLQAGLANTPYQGFPNQQMDMTQNRSEFFNFQYQGDRRWGVLDARLFWQNVRHEMNVGKDKSTFPKPMWMPMDTHGRDLGYSVKLGLNLSEQHTLQLGNEFHRFVLDDVWPAVPGKAPMMGPDAFVNVNAGHRPRLAWFAEVASKWNSKWTTLVGIRNDTVWTNTGPASGYSVMYATDVNKFNSVGRSRADLDFDATALARYEPNAVSTYEMGFARKTRAPNLYERYAWSTNWMASGMINWFGDGNYYVGNVNLRPEVAHTVSGTASWHDRARKSWEIKLTPYQTYLRDYIGVDVLATRSYSKSTFSQLRFANHDARIYGVDLAGNVAAWQSARFGSGEITGVAGWLRGKTLDTGHSLYQMMPLSARIGLSESLKGWTGGPEIQLIGRKSNVDPLRFEQKAPGYALLNLHAGYQLSHLRFDAGCDNLLNNFYYFPLGGVNYDDFMASGRTNQIRPLTGPGRSVYGGLTIQF